MSQSPWTINKALLKALRGFLDIPDGCTALTLKMQVDKAPSLEVTTIVFDAGVSSPTTQRFELVAADDLEGK